MALNEEDTCYAKVGKDVDGKFIEYFCLIGKRSLKQYSPNLYHIWDNWFWEFNRKHARVPTIDEFQIMNYRRGIAGNGKISGRLVSCTFPDSSVRSVYLRLLYNPNISIQKAFGTAVGHCGPVGAYRDYRGKISYMSAHTQLSVYLELCNLTNKAVDNVWKQYLTDLSQGIDNCKPHYEINPRTGLATKLIEED